MVAIKVRTKQLEGVTELRLLIVHPMHTGRQKDTHTGAIIPAHYLSELRIEHNGGVLADCRLSTAVSRDPYLSFRFRGGRPGDRIAVHWVDNLGASGTYETVVS